MFTGTFIYNPKMTAPDLIEDYINDLEDFTVDSAKSDTAVYHVQGLNCNRCVGKVCLFVPRLCLFIVI